jgi:hypothetical protein
VATAIYAAAFVAMSRLRHTVVEHAPHNLNGLAALEYVEEIQL